MSSCTLCKLDEAFTVEEMMHFCKDCKLDCENAGKSNELNCHLEISNGRMTFSYSGEADDIFQNGANVAINQLWDKLHLIFYDDKWRKKYHVRDAKEFFGKYSPKDIFDGVIK